MDVKMKWQSKPTGNCSLKLEINHECKLVVTPFKIFFSFKQKKFDKEGERNGKF